MFGIFNPEMRHMLTPSCTYTIIYVYVRPDTDSSNLNIKSASCNICMVYLLQSIWHFSWAHPSTQSHMCWLICINPWHHHLLILYLSHSLSHFKSYYVKHFLFLHIFNKNIKLNIIVWRAHWGSRSSKYLFESILVYKHVLRSIWLLT